MNLCVAMMVVWCIFFNLQGWNFLCNFVGDIMIQYKKFKLSNVLTLIVHEDHDTPLATVNILYNVGSRNENPERTGFAHLFEHLMFGGTDAVPDYDSVVNGMGGECNAYTTSDYTIYYLTVPACGLEKALWLEADRMRLLGFSSKSLAVQQKVVTEEYNQRYMNRPYGDVWMLLKENCYSVHPYRWSTIGKDIKHVQEATLEDVKDFFFKYYRPNNAIMAVAGDVETERVVEMVERYFGDITKGEQDSRIVELPAEPDPKGPKLVEVRRDVPQDVVYMVFLMGNRFQREYYVANLLSDVLSNGKSSRMYNELVKGKGLFSEVDAVITGEVDRGMFVVSGKLNEGVSVEDAEHALRGELDRVMAEGVTEYELRKVKNNFENTFVYSQYKAAERAANLCYYEWLGHIEWVNEEPKMNEDITCEEMREVAKNLFDAQRCVRLRYLKKGKE